MCKTCKDCRHGEYHGYPPEGAPEWYVFTVSFWCPLTREHKNPWSEACDSLEEGEPRIVRDDVDW